MEKRPSKPFMQRFVVSPEFNQPHFRTDIGEYIATTQTGVLSFSVSDYPLIRIKQIQFLIEPKTVNQKFSRFPIHLQLALNGTAIAGRKISYTSGDSYDTLTADVDILFSPENLSSLSGTVVVNAFAGDNAIVLADEFVPIPKFQVQVSLLGEYVDI